MISLQAVKEILGIKETVDISLEDMIKNITICFLPSRNNSNKLLNKFSDEFSDILVGLGVKVIEFNEAWVKVSVSKRIRRFIKYYLNNFIYIFRTIVGLPKINFYLSCKTISRLCADKKLKKNVTIICVGEQDVDNLVMQHITSFKTNSVITIINIPENITEVSEFMEHFNTSMSLFAYHMTNIVVGVNEKKWMMYNFNASHPMFRYPDPDFKNNILKSIIPKLAAPISPHKLSDFEIKKDKFNLSEKKLSFAINDMIVGSKLFSKTNLYPDGKKIDDLPFRENFHKLIGKLHLDNRSGMSFGFFAYQLPCVVDKPISYDQFYKNNGNVFKDKDFFINNFGKMFILHEIQNEKIVIPISEVWVLSLKSGSHKTNFNPNYDLVKIGLVNGSLKIQWSDKTKFDNTYKPSFDTKVILAHALCNVVIAQVAMYFNKNIDYVSTIENKGFSICHWHGYFNKKLIMKDVIMYGEDNPHVSCSSPQSAIYAFKGKFLSVVNNLNNIEKYVGDIHIEPHHGINVSYKSLKDLANYIINNPDATALGNKYLY